MVTKFTKRSLLTGIIIILMMMTYSLCFCLYSFMLKPNIDTNMQMLWITYGFTMGVFFIAFVTSVLAFERSDLRSRVFGVPIVLVGFGAIIFQVAFDIIIMVIGMFAKFSETAWIFILIPEALFVVFVIITIIVRQAYRGLIQAIDKKEIACNFVNELLVQIEMVCKTNPIPKLDKELNKLYETVRYSDPVSVKEVHDIENEINDAVELLKSEVSTGELEEAQKAIAKIATLATERNLRLKLVKRK